MKKIFLSNLLFVISLHPAFCQLVSPGILYVAPGDKSPLYSGIYLGQTPPGDHPVRFAPPGLRANGSWFWHGSPNFSPDLTEMFFVKYYEPENKTEINYMKMTDGVWSDPAPPSFSDTGYIENNPRFSLTGDTVFFFSSRPGGPYLFVTRLDSGWSEPSPLPVSLPDSLGSGWQFFISVSGELYLDLWKNAGNMDIYHSGREGGQYLEPVKLGPSINTEYQEWGTTMDPQERVLIFASNRPGGSGLHDLYLSRRNGDDWTDAENLGSNINGSHEDGFPSLSPDGLYLFFTTAKPGDLGYNPYWVRADAVDPILGIQQEPATEEEMTLEQNSPNPAGGTTLIRFTTSKPGHCRMILHDLTGREVRRLFDAETPGGQVEVRVSLSGIPRGIYFYSLISCEGARTKRMIIH